MNMKAKSAIILFFSLFLAAYLKGQTVNIGDIFAQEGGSTVQWQPYACSTEANTEGQTWAVDFGDHDRDWGGLFISKSKSNRENHYY